MTRRLAALTLLMLCASFAHADGGLLASRGTCVDGEPRMFLAVDGASATDCSTGGSTYDVPCCCLNGTWAACNGAASPGSGGGTIDRDASETNIDNDASETTVYTYTIPAGTLSATGEIRLKVLSEFLNNTGAGRGYTLKFKLGGTTVIEYTTGASAFGSTATRRNFTILVTVSQTGATNSQIVTVEHYAASTAGIFGTLTTGVGLTMSNAVNVGHWNSGALAVDMTVSQTLAVTVTLSTANANLEWRTYAATLELLNP